MVGSGQPDTKIYPSTPSRLSPVPLEREVEYGSDTGQLHLCQLQLTSISLVALSEDKLINALVHTINK